MAEQPQFNPPVQNQYQSPQGRYIPPQGVPVRRGGGGSTIVVWLLSGCGLVAVLGVLIGIFFIKSIGASDLVKNQGGIQVARRNLVAIRTSLNQYVQEHKGNYPRTLEESVDPAYLSYASSSTGKTINVSYDFPAPDATDDTAIAGFYVGEMTMNLGTRIQQWTYVRLLKDGTIVQEQISRSPLPRQ